MTESAQSGLYTLGIYLRGLVQPLALRYRTTGAAEFAWERINKARAKYVQNSKGMAPRFIEEYDLFGKTFVIDLSDVHYTTLEEVDKITAGALEVGLVMKRAEARAHQAMMSDPQLKLLMTQMPPNMKLG